MFIIFCYNANMYFGVYETKKIFSTSTRTRPEKRNPSHRFVSEPHRHHYPPTRLRQRQLVIINLNSSSPTTIRSAKKRTRPKRILLLFQNRIFRPTTLPQFKYSILVGESEAGFRHYVRGQFSGSRWPGSRLLP